VDAARHRLFEPAELLLRRDELGRAAEHVLAQRRLLLDRRPLVVEGDAGALGEDEVAAVGSRLACEDAKERRLAGPVPTGEGESLLGLELEADAVEERRPRELLAEVRGDENGHAPMVAEASRPEARNAGRGRVYIV
jgi:hypothetical protein